MEPSGVLLHESSWSSFDTTVVLPYEDSEMMAHLLAVYHSPNDQDHHQDPSFRLPLASWFSDTAAADSYCCSLENGNASASLNEHHWSHQCNDSSAGDFFAPHDSCHLNESNAVSSINASFTSMNYCMVGGQNSDQSLVPISQFGDLACLNDESSSDDIANSSINLSEPVAPQDQMLQRKTKHHSKKARVSTNVTESLKNVPSTRAHKRTKSCDEEARNTTMNCNSCSYSSEDDSKASQDLNGRKRADQEPSTSPQSLYARKRRERINERLRILQNLVPNGTKVDISTMLEEAVHYVKFLQLQIKLLSSDELWMYAPIAYNGIDIGLDLKISPPEQQ